ncbi:MAG: hypothetical protein V1847_03545 [Candidatus Diapherotrites archaeon]
MSVEELIPRFRGTELQKAKRCIEWTWAWLQKVDWPAEKVQEKLFKQTPAELIESRQVFYMNPCGPQTIVCVQALKANGFKPTVVVDLLKMHNAINPHFAIEFSVQGKPYFAEFKTSGVNFGKGKYSKPWIKGAVSLERLRFSGEKFGMRKTISQACGPFVLQSFAGRGFRLKDRVKVLAEQAIPQKFQQFQQTIGKRAGKKIIHPVH